jgi:hypothetical protein
MLSTPHAPPVLELLGLGAVWRDAEEGGDGEVRALDPELLREVDGGINGQPAVRGGAEAAGDVRVLHRACILAELPERSASQRGFMLGERE